MCLFLISCSQNNKDKEKVTSDYFGDELNIMHIEANNPDFIDYIDNVSKKLNIKINIIPCPEDANNRQAEISNKLYSGSTDIDLISVNDEMVSEFKSRGYLEPLDDIMTKDVLQSYPKDYVESVSMYNKNVFSVPYMMDIMMFWVNEKYAILSNVRDIKNLDDFSSFLNYDYGTGLYAYGGAWEETYIYNDLSQFINMFGGDYYNWSNDNTRNAVVFLHDMLKYNHTSKAQMIDRYEQMEQKFIDGKYGSIFMYSGAINTFYNSGKYGEDGIHVVKLPNIKNLSTNIATWQYVLNKASKNKSAAKRFLQYISSKDGCVEYSNVMKQVPARIDVILDKNININVPDIDTIRGYVENCSLKARPLTSESMTDISEMGKIFQKYLLDEMALDEFCHRAQKIVDRNYSK